MPKAPPLPQDDDETETETPVVVKAPRNDPLVWVGITRFGAGKVSTGVHNMEVGDVKAKEGERMQVAKSVAASLEARGFAVSE